MQSSLVEGLLATDAGEAALDTLSVLVHLDPGRAIDHRFRRAEVFRDTGNTAAAKREILEVLEDVPHFWEAQRLLLEIVELDRVRASTPEGGGDDSPAR